MSGFSRKSEIVGLAIPENRMVKDDGRGWIDGFLGAFSRFSHMTTKMSLLDMREVQSMRAARESMPPVEEVAESQPAEFELNGTFLDRSDSPDPTGRRSMQTVPSVDRSPENLELILNSSRTLLPFHFLRTGDRLGRAVVKLLRSDGASGTGFLVAPGILLTNHHVLPDEPTAALTIVLANFEAAHPGTTPGRPASVPLDPGSLFVTNSELDFTFCGVQGLDFLGTIPPAQFRRSIASALSFR